MDVSSGKSNIRRSPRWRVDGGAWQHASGRLFPSVESGDLIYAAGHATPGAGVVDFGFRMLYTGSGGNFTYELSALRVNLQ